MIEVPLHSECAERGTASPEWSLERHPLRESASVRILHPVRHPRVRIPPKAEQRFRALEGYVPSPRHTIARRPDAAPLRSAITPTGQGSIRWAVHVPPATAPPPTA